MFGKYLKILVIMIIIFVSNKLSLVLFTYCQEIKQNLRKLFSQIIFKAWIVFYFLQDILEN